MEPRLKTSTKKSKLPQELLDRIQKEFESSFEDACKTGEFIVKGYICPAEVLFKVGYLKNGEITQHNFQLSIEFDYKKETAQTNLEVLIEVANSLMFDFLEKKQKDFPMQWKKISVDNKEVFLQYTKENDSLEEQANRFLNSPSSSALVEEELEH